MNRIFTTLLNFTQKYKIIFFLLFTTLLRVPHLIRADYRLDSDGAHHWIVMDYIFSGKFFALHPYGLTHLGITDFLLVYPFTFIFGHTQITYQIMLHLVFLIVSFTIYKLSKISFGNKAADFSLLLLALPNPTIFHFLLRPYGGHVLAITLTLLSLYTIYLAETTEAKGKYYSISGFLIGLSYYTSHLAIISIVPVTAYLALSLWKERKVTYFLYSFFFILIGLVPSVIGKLIQPFPDNYPNASFSIKIQNIPNNFEFAVVNIFPALLDIFYLPGLEEGGFFPSKDLRIPMQFLGLLFLGIGIYFLSRQIRKVISNGLGSIRITGNYTLFFFLLLSLNIGAVLVTTNGLEGFGLRFLLPAIIASVPLYAALFSGEINSNRIEWLPSKLRIGLIFLHFLIYILAFGRGYLDKKSAVYTAQATLGIDEIISYLKENNVKYCAADYWMANPIIYETNFKILATPIDSLSVGPRRNPEIVEKVLNNPKGVECVINNWFTPLQNKAKDPQKFIETNLFAFRILRSKVIGDSIVYIVERE